jgi:hypothetical protein
MKRTMTPPEGENDDDAMQQQLAPCHPYIYSSSMHVMPLPLATRGKDSNHGASALYEGASVATAQFLTEFKQNYEPDCR